MREVARRRESVHRAVVPTSDRAFRALARAQPDVVVGLLRAVTPALLLPHAVPVPDDVAPTHLDGLPPEIDADFAARMKVTTIVLPEVPASSLLSDPATTCFAAGSDAEGRPNEVLCAQVASALRERGASWPERHMAVVAAAMRGRYESMVAAMEQANLEPVIIEDLVKFGEDRGYERGRLEEERATLRRVLALRKLGLTADGEARINACMDLATLQRWLDQAVLAATADEALQ
jgi:hypothetical protein